MMKLQLQNYRVIKKVGQGGMGLVYVAEDLSLGRLVALKVLAPYLVQEPEILERFRFEARHQAQLTHPNITMVYSFVQEEEKAYLVLEFIDGETLESRISREGRIPARETASIFRKILGAIEYAHSKGVIHRDIKPGNIAFTLEGNVKIMDFGIALNVAESGRLTRTGHVLGTPHYMAPEQILSQEVTFATDIYALGITLFEMVTGRLPFDSKSDYEVRVAQINNPPPSPRSFGYPDITPELEEVILKALAKAPEDRFASAREFRQALEAAVESDRLATMVKGRPPDQATRVAKGPRKRSKPAPPSPPPEIADLAPPPAAPGSTIPPVAPPAAVQEGVDLPASPPRDTISTPPPLDAEPPKSSIPSPPTPLPGPGADLQEPVASPPAEEIGVPAVTPFTELPEEVLTTTPFPEPPSAAASAPPPEETREIPVAPPPDERPPPPISAEPDEPAVLPPPEPVDGLPPPSPTPETLTAAPAPAPAEPEPAPPEPPAPPVPEPPLPQEPLPPAVPEGAHPAPPVRARRFSRPLLIFLPLGLLAALALIIAFRVLLPLGPSPTDTGVVSSQPGAASRKKVALPAPVTPPVSPAPKASPAAPSQAPAATQPDKAKTLPPGEKPAAPPQARKPQPDELRRAIKDSLAVNGFSEVEVQVSEAKGVVIAGRVRNVGQKYKIIRIINAMGLGMPTDYNGLKVVKPAVAKTAPKKRPEALETTRQEPEPAPAPPPPAVLRKPLPPRLDRDNKGAVAEVGKEKGSAPPKPLPPRIDRGNIQF
jgi:serine/threonine protein kinase